MDPMTLPAAGLARRTTSGELTCAEVVEASLARIAEHDPRVNAFSVVLAEQARAEARALDEADGPRGPLHGVPVAIKEEVDVAGCVTTFGGGANAAPAPRDGELVRRLRAAGAVVVGKTRMPEFGQWPFTESVAGGITRNPWDTSRTPGGSSGGSAVAVALGMVPVAIGGDGGGSIRIPAAYNGLVGLKPTRGRVTTDPYPHLWWALGTCGPLTRTVADTAMVYDVISGNVPGDRYQAPALPQPLAGAVVAGPGRLRIGWSTKPVTRGIGAHAEHRAAVEETAAALISLGHDVREVDPRYPDPTLAFVPQFFAGVRAEAAAVEHPDRLERRTRQVCLLGGWVGNRVLERALAAGDSAARKADRIFADVDVLLTPVVGTRPREVGVLDSGGPLRAALASRPLIAWTALWNVTGHPAASIPAGLGSDGLPLAVQAVARHGGEGTLLGLAAELESARPWPLLTEAGE